MMKHYPLADLLPKELRVLGKFRNNPEIRAVITGEYRIPRRGEWYLSGAEPMAFKAHQDLSGPYNIVKMVRVKQVCTEEITPVFLVKD